MRTLKQLKEERAQKVEAMRTLSELALKENRDWSPEEQGKVDTLDSEIDSLDQEIARAEKVQARLASAAAGQSSRSGLSTGEQKDVEKYSWLGAVRRAAGFESVDGIYKEMHEEAVKEAREAGVTGSLKGVMIPSVILNEKRNVTATGGTNGSQGGTAVATNLGSFIDALRSSLVVAGLGADFMTGLIGNVDFPEENAVFAPNWLGETAAQTASNPTFTKKSITPKRLAGHMDVSEQILIQTSPSIEARLRAQLVRGVQEAIDSAAINGSGTGQVPLGILNTAGIGSVVGGTDGLAATYDHIVRLMGEVDAANALQGSLGYLTNSKVRTALKLAKRDAGSGLFVWGDDNNSLNGYTAGVTNLVPGNITKGTGTNLSAAIFGNFNDLIIGQWAGIEILPDPYTQAANGMIRMHVKTFVDVLVARAKSFAAMKDIVA